MDEPPMETHKWLSIHKQIRELGIFSMKDMLDYICKLFNKDIEIL